MVVLLATGPALLGLHATLDPACDYLPDSRGHGRQVEFDASDKLAIVSECRTEHADGAVLEASTFNWIGLTSAVFFLVGAFASSAGVVGLIDRRRAAEITALCVGVCLAMVVIFFA